MTSDEWCHYLSKEEALTVNGTTKKKKIEDGLTLINFFDQLGGLFELRLNGPPS